MYKFIQFTSAVRQFAATGWCLCIVSQNRVRFLEPKRAGFLEMTPLATAICLNVVVTKLSLVNLTPSYQCVSAMFVTNFALMNFFLYQVTIPQRAFLASIPALLLSLYYNSPDGQSDSSETKALIAAIVACWMVFMTAMYLAIDWVVQ